MNGNSLLSLKKMNDNKSRMTKRTHESYSTSYNDPWFYNQKNLTFQINSMRTSSDMQNEWIVKSFENFCVY